MRLQSLMLHMRCAVFIFFWYAHWRRVPTHFRASTFSTAGYISMGYDIPTINFLRSHFTSLLLNNIMFPLMACNPQVHGGFIWTSMVFNVIIGRFSNNLLYSKFNTVTFICILIQFLHHVCRGTLH